jgi:hypothetical protein
MPATVIQEKPRAGANAVDQKVEGPVAIDVREGRARGVIARKIQARLGRYIREMPSAEVPKQRHMAFEGADEDIAPTVAINISQSYARSIEPDLILGGVFITELIGEVNAGLRWVQERKTRCAVLWNLKRKAMVTFSALGCAGNQNKPNQAEKTRQYSCPPFAAYHPHR